MKKLKRFLAIIISIVMVMCSTLPSLANGSEEVPETSESKIVEQLKEDLGEEKATEILKNSDVSVDEESETAIVEESEIESEASETNVEEENEKKDVEESVEENEEKIEEESTTLSNEEPEEDETTISSEEPEEDATTASEKESEKDSVTESLEETKEDVTIEGTEEDVTVEGIEEETTIVSEKESEEETVTESIEEIKEDTINVEETVTKVNEEKIQEETTMLYEETEISSEDINSIASKSNVEVEDLNITLLEEVQAATTSEAKLFDDSGNTHYLQGSWYDETAAGVLKKNVTKIKLQNTGSAPSSYSATFDVDGLTAYIVNGTECVIYIPSGHSLKLYQYSSGAFSFGVLNSTLGIYESSLTTIDNLNVLDTTEATTMNNLFYGNNKLNSIDLSNFNTNNVTNMNNMFSRCEKLQSLDLSNFDTSNVTNMGQMFWGCEKLQSLDLSNFDTGNVTFMVEMFYNCKSCTSINVESFNTANVTDFSGMFFGCEALQSIDLNSFDTNQATRITQMFYNCKSLESIDVSGFDTSNVQSFQNLFNGCKSLLSIDVSSFDTSNATNLSAIFYGCEKLTSIDVSNFDTSNANNISYMFTNCYNLSNLTLFSTTTENVSSMRYMFYKCRSIESLDLSSFNTTNTTDMYQMFYECSNLETLNISNFDMTNTTYDDMLYGLSSINTINISSSVASIINNMKLEFDWKKQGSETIYQYDTVHNRTTIPNEPGIYERATSGSRVTVTFDTDGGSYVNSQTVDLNTQIVKPNDPTKDNNIFVYWYKDNINIEFDFASAITESFTLHAKWEPVIIITSYWYIKNGNELHLSSTVPTDPSYTPGQTFSNFNSSSDIPWSQFSTQITKVVIDNTLNLTSTKFLFDGLSYLTEIENISNLNTGNVTNMFNMFYGCASLQNIDLSAFNTSKVTNMIQVFMNCRSLTTLDLTSFDTSNVTMMTGMFQGCQNLTSIDISSFDTRKVYQMTNIFNNCKKIIDIDLSNFNTERVTSLHEMFGSCEMLTSLDLSGFNTQRVNDMGLLFNGCTALQTIYVSNDFVTTYVTTGNQMFLNCSSLVGGNGTTYDSSHIDKEYARIDSTATPGYFTYREAPTPTPTLDNISIDTNPSKLMYSVGEKFNPNGLKIKLNYSDGTSDIVTYNDTTKNSFAFNPSLDTALDTTHTNVVVIYSSKTANIPITVEGGETPILISISVSSSPRKTSYVEGNYLDPLGLAIRLKYSDSSTENVSYNNTTKNSFSFNPSLTTRLSTSMSSVTVTYGGKSTSFKIKVSSGGYTPSSGGGSSGGSGGGTIASIQNQINAQNGLPSSAVPSTSRVAGVKSISQVVDTAASNWAVDPQTGRWKLNTIGMNGQAQQAVNGFYLLTNVVVQVVNGNPVSVQANNTYYFDASGNMVTGWVQTADSKWYFFENAKTSEEGKMSIGWKQVQGSWYYFTPEGDMMTSGMTPDGFVIGADGKWQG